MSYLTVPDMKGYLSKSLSSWNNNKLYGLLAEVKLRHHLKSLGFEDRISSGGWIVRSVNPDRFSGQVTAFFPERIQVGKSYPAGRSLPQPSHGLHTICSTLHQIGIQSFFCAPTIEREHEPRSVKWHAIQLGLPSRQSYRPFPINLDGFTQRSRRYNYLRYSTSTASIPRLEIPEEFTKEHVRVAFSTRYMSEISDIDGLLWGQQHTYPIEIKEKTPATHNHTGDYFGLDVGPFAKRAFYAAKRGNLNSLFIVREIDDETTRNLVNWWYITFDKLAQYASWVPIGGGPSMVGGAQRHYQDSER